MELATIVIAVENGIATITDTTLPPGVTIQVIIRDYDIADNDREVLDVDATGRPCFESITEYHNTFI